MENRDIENEEALRAAGERIRGLERKEGIWDTSGYDKNLFRAAGQVYPVYTAYETRCNKKEGYHDIMMQMRILRDKLNEHITFSDAAAFLNMLIETIRQMNPQIYEVCRELTDIFRATVRRTLPLREKGTAADRLFREALAKACEDDVLLAEKYQQYIAEDGKGMSVSADRGE